MPCPTPAALPSRLAVILILLSTTSTNPRAHTANTGKGTVLLDTNGGTFELTGGLQVQGPADFQGPVRIDGQNVAKSLAAVRAAARLGRARCLCTEWSRVPPHPSRRTLACCAVPMGTRK